MGGGKRGGPPSPSYYDPTTVSASVPRGPLWLGYECLGQLFIAEVHENVN